MKIQRLFGATVFFFGAVLTASIPARAQATRTDSSTSQVRTVGSSTRHVAPNVAIIRLNIVAEGRTPKEAGRRLSVRMDSLRHALAGMGVPRDSLFTASEWSWWGGRLETIVSNGRFVQLPRPDSLGRLSYNLQDTLFRAHDALEVRIPNMSKIGAVIDSALARGVADMSPVQFQATELSTARDQALKEATEDARRQAELIAAASGMKLGKVVSMSTYSQIDRYSGMGLNSVVITGMAGGGGGGGTEVIPRALPVSMTVYGLWELVPRP
jgi:uncharacterized protein